MTKAKELAEVLRSAAAGLSGKRQRLPIALTAIGSELPVEALLAAAELASDQVEPVIIGPKGIDGFVHHKADDLTAAHTKMNELFKSGEIAGAVTLH